MTRVIVDTSVWSMALRRKPDSLSASERSFRGTLEQLIDRGAVLLIGPIAQEILSGIRDRYVFDQLANHLRAFPFEALLFEDFEEAARCNNLCRAGGVAGSAVDFLICAVAIRRQADVFTLDNDFERYANHLPLRLYSSS